jgi:hypothetical protein
VLARVLERHRELAVDLLVHGAGHEHAARVREGLQPGGDVDAVAVDPRVVVDDIAEIDADPKAHASVLGHGLIAGGHDSLDLDRAFGGTDDAGKFSEDAITGGVDDPTSVAGDQRQDHALMRLEVAHGGRLVFVHEPAVAGDVGGKPLHGFRVCGQFEITARTRDSARNST